MFGRQRRLYRAGAGLLIHSFAEALKVDTGVEAANVVPARIALTREHRASDDAANSIRERLFQAMKEIPGVTSVALSFSTPFQGGLPINAFTLENDTLPPGAPQPGAFRVIVTPGYAETLGLKLIEGCFYEEADLAPGRRLFVVDQSFARKFFPNGSAVGGRFAFGGRPGGLTLFPRDRRPVLIQEVEYLVVLSNRWHRWIASSTPTARPISARKSF